MKAWIITTKCEFNVLVIFAETRGKARYIALHTDEFEDCEFCDIEVRREPSIDKYYKEGEVIMDWENPKDRIALVKECGFHCEYVELCECEICPAKNYCDVYQDYLNEEGADNEQREADRGNGESH